MTPRAAALSREVARMEETTTFTCPLKRGKPKFRERRRELFRAGEE